MEVIWILLLAFWRLVAGDCGANTGPAGSLECVAFAAYNNKPQWSTCLSNAYIQQKSGGTHVCTDETRRYCYYQCMIEIHNLEEGPVYSDCACDPRTPIRTTITLPAECYSPDGTDCTWYKQCLEAKYPCKESGSSYAIGYGDKFCKLYSQHYSKFDETGRQWIDAVRRCLQVAVVPLIRQYISIDCSDIKQTAFKSHSGCYTSPYPGAPSICTLGVKNIFQVFVTIKSAFVDDFYATGDQLLETALACGSHYAENTIQFVLERVNTATDYMADVYSKVTKGIRGYLKNKLNSISDDIFISPFALNQTRNRRSTGDTKVNVLFLSRAKYDLNYNGNLSVNVKATVDYVMNAIETGEIKFGLQTRSVIQCVDTGCANPTRTVIPPISAALEGRHNSAIIAIGVLLTMLCYF